MLFLGHVIEEREALFSEWRWASDSSGAVRECPLEGTPQHIQDEPIVLVPALTVLPNKNVGFRFFCDCPTPFPTKAGTNLADRRLAFLNRFPDL